VYSGMEALGVCRGGQTAQVMPAAFQGD